MSDLSTTTSLRDFARRLDNMTGVLGIALAQWAARDDSRAQPEIRQAANMALAVFDDMGDAMHRARRQLAAEIRASDDAAAKRADALIASAK